MFLFLIILNDDYMFSTLFIIENFTTPSYMYTETPQLRTTESPERMNSTESMFSSMFDKIKFA